jgi:hypothetical protein
VATLLENNQYIYPAIPLPVPSSIKVGLEKPLVNTFIKEGNSFQFLFKKNQSDQIRYIVVYSTEHPRDLNTNDPSQIVEKVFIDAKSDSIKYSISKDKIYNAKKVAFTFIDFYGNESIPEIVNLHTEIKPN